MNVLAADPRLEAVTRRLYGSANRVAWRPADISRVLARFGLGENAGAVSEASFRRTADVAHRAPEAPAEAGERDFAFVISTDDVDRMGDTIAIKGWKLDAYRKNPVVLWAHAGGLLPVGRAVRIWIDGHKLKATARLAPAASNPDAERVFSLIRGGFLAATSVGFLPLRFAFSDDPGRRFGIDFLEQELLEFSIVTVPANPAALIDPGQSGKSAASATARRRREIETERRRREIALLRLGARG